MVPGEQHLGNPLILEGLRLRVVCVFNQIVGERVLLRGVAVSVDRMFDMMTSWASLAEIQQPQVLTFSLRNWCLEVTHERVSTLESAFVCDPV